MSAELEAYRRHVESRIESLRDTFARAAIGDFSEDVQLSEEHDEFTETFLGVQVMLEVIRAQIAEMQTLNDELHSKLAALKKEDRAKNDFIAMLAHELRNPLSPVISSLEIIELQGHLHESTPELLDAISMHVRTITRLLDDLLDISRITRKKFRLEKKAVELQGVIHKAIRTIRALADKKRQRITIELPDESIWLSADPLRLEQIFINVLYNAAKYTETEGDITVRAERRGDRAVVRIRDTGIGILPDMLKRIFEPFVQVHTVSQSYTPGTGLGIGLTLTRRLVEMHSGTIEASSEGKGKGSEFIISLPMPSAVQLSIDTEHPALDAMEKRPALHVLIVDDNQPAAEGLQILLRYRGYEVSTAFSWREGYDRIAKEKPDVAILDIGLPDMDGYELARKIRSEIAPAPVLIALTGYGRPEDKALARKAGFGTHLTKPVGVADVEAAIARFTASDTE